MNVRQEGSESARLGCRRLWHEPEDQRLDEREKQQHSEDELVRRGRECNKSAGSQSHRSSCGAGDQENDIAAVKRRSNRNIALRFERRSRGRTVFVEDTIG